MSQFLNDNFSFVVRGGWLMVPIIICSVVSLAVIIERTLFFLRFKRFDSRKIVKKIITFYQKGHFQDAITLCQEKSYYLTNILKEALLRRDKSKQAIEEAIERVSLEEMPKIEKNINILSTLAHVSPLLGLLGTVVGLVKSFYIIEQRAASAGMVNPSDVAGGIWEALLTTAAGLVVAIISYIAYNYFAHKVNRYTLEAEKSSTSLLEVIINQKS
jgi:biopolymer transport protein ExbB